MFSPWTRIVTHAGLTFAAIAIVASTPLGMTAPLRPQAPVRARVIVGLKTPHQPEATLTSEAAVAAQRAAQAQAVQAALDSVRSGAVTTARTFETLPFFVVEADAAALAELSRSPWVASIDHDVARPMALHESVPLVDAPAAWDQGFGGEGWAVAVLDTGVDSTHAFLAGKVISEACYSTTDSSGATSSQSLCPGGWSAVTSSGSAAPCAAADIPDCDHGTHVAGIAAGSGPSFSGVARDGRIVAMQVFSRFSGAECGGPAACLLAWDSDVIAGLDRVYALRNTLDIAAVNLSLGSSAPYDGACDAMSASMKAAIDQLRVAGIATVAAAGNMASTSALSFPACISSAVSVGSTTKTDVISTFTNTSAELSLVAPGEPINSSVPGGGFAYKMGTSMAAPHVAGAWAVLKQRKPAATVDEILNALRAAGKPIVDSRPGRGRSFPRLRVGAALNALPVPRPAMAIDAPGAGRTAEPFVVAGWAIDRGASHGSGVDAVHVWAYSADGASPIFVGAATLGWRRDDVAAVYGAQSDLSGYQLTVRNLVSGSYTLVVSARSEVSGTFNQSRTVDVTIPSSWPEMSLDGPANPSTQTGQFAVGGWALDRMAASDTGVDAIHVWAFPTDGGSPVFVGQTSCSGMRTDVGDLFGRQFDRAGYYLSVANLAPGTYDIAVYAHSSVSGAFNQMRAARVTIAR